MRFFKSAQYYHENTRYKSEDLQMAHKEYRWGPQLETFKTYKNKPAFDLPKAYVKSKLTFNDAIKISAGFSQLYKISDQVLGIELLSTILTLTNGVTQSKKLAEHEINFRAAPSASALYPTEIYVYCSNVDGLDKGLYYYDVTNHRLVRLSGKNLSKKISDAGFNLQSLNNAPAVIFLTSLWQRNSWKFKERAYRYCTLDAGYICENLAVSCASFALTAHLLGDFIDDQLNSLLEIDGTKEHAMLMIPIGYPGQDLIDDRYQFAMYNEDNYQHIKQQSLCEYIHNLSKHYHSTENLPKVQVKFPFARRPVSRNIKGELVDLIDIKADGEQSVAKVITRRRSKYTFPRIPISKKEISILLKNVNCIPDLYNYPCLQTYLAINSVKDVEGGLYLYHPRLHKLELIKSGNYRAEISYLTISQDIAFNGSVLIFFAVDFEQINLFSNRGYRYAHFNAGMASENLYLSATALGLGARGIGNFYDDGLNEFFRLNKPNENILAGVVVGRV